MGLREILFALGTGDAGAVWGQSASTNITCTDRGGFLAAYKSTSKPHFLGTQGGERCSCMNNKTGILLSIRRDKKPPGTQRKATLLYRSPVGYSAILLYGASLADAGSTSHNGGLFLLQGCGEGWAGQDPPWCWVHSYPTAVDADGKSSSTAEGPKPRETRSQHAPVISIPISQEWQPEGDIKVTQ